MKDHPKHDKKEVSLAGMTFKGTCHKCSEQGHKAYNCPENGDSGSTINGTCQSCGKLGHKAIDCWEKEENADKRPSGWVSSKKKNETKGSKDVGAASIEFVL
jgi:hypothetical protein